MIILHYVLVCMSSLRIVFILGLREYGVIGLYGRCTNTVWIDRFARFVGAGTCLRSLGCLPLRARNQVLRAQKPNKGHRSSLITHRHDVWTSSIQHRHKIFLVPFWNRWAGRAAESRKVPWTDQRGLQQRGFPIHRCDQNFVLATGRKRRLCCLFFFFPFVYLLMK